MSLNLNDVYAKELEEYRRQVYVERHDHLKFPHPPCASICSKNLTRFHLTCLTCWERVEYYKKRGYKNLSRYTVGAYVIEPPNGKGFRITQRHFNYALFVPLNRHGKVPLWKKLAIKFPLAFAQWLSERHLPKVKRIPKAICFLESTSPKGVLMPKYSRSYGFFMPLKVNGKINEKIGVIIKFPLTIAERIAEWNP